MVNAQDKKGYSAPALYEESTTVLDVPQPMAQHVELEGKHQADQCYSFESEHLPSQSSTGETPSTINELLSTLEHKRISVPAAVPITAQYAESNFTQTDNKHTLTDTEDHLRGTNETKGMRVNQPRNKLWLLASKGTWFILGSVLVIVAGIVSHYHHNAVLASNCTNTTTGNYTL